jgi:5'-nucleotidase/UDP-sugar diphosphatase
MTKRQLNRRVAAVDRWSPRVSRGGIPPQAESSAWSLGSRAIAFCLVLFLTLACGGVAGATCAEGQRLALLHFNDFHGQLEPYADPETQASVGGIARLAAAVEKARAEDPGRAVLLLFAGDLLQGTVTSSLFLGVPDVILFDNLGVDAAVMGNHELDYGQDAFRHLAALAHFPFLTANVQTSPKPLPVKPHVVISKPGGLKVAILGLTTRELKTTTHPRNVGGVSVEDPSVVARRLAATLREEADMLIVLSHMGIAEDRKLAQEIPDIDLIVGGHNHNLYTQPVMEGSVAIVQAGERGRWLGRMDLACSRGRMVRTGYQMLSMDAGVPRDALVAADVGRVVAEAEKDLNREVGYAKVELSARREEIRRRESGFGDWVADLAREVTHADVALFNGGNFRASIPAGPVTLKQIYEAFPFRDELVVGRLTGAQLLEALQRSASLNPEDNPGGFLQVSGLRYSIANGTLESAILTGRPIDPTRRYLVVVPDFLAEGGDGYAMLKEMQDKVMTGLLVNDMVIEAFRTKTPITATVDGRIRRKQRDGI